eukprot:CAMPEP_0194672624 /NCGR_PEP_ID=MMETSP0295-20121207/6573_1 /TAXON_ID=39354 /ORGANISM="Heterosigma akashiwo, Strain CCMP2393" /LENGTH=95 /DNA_ID=CAMNT_0039556403 /DNA_START=158 /DNA_END=445 /DNA_ORIENTATION=-
MDLWDPTQAKALVLGGNAQLKGFFRRQKLLKDKTLKERCSSSQATYYREKLLEQVQMEMSSSAESGGWAVLQKDKERLDAEAGLEQSKKEEEARC